MSDEFKWTTYHEGKFGFHHALHVRIGKELARTWRVTRGSRGWVASFEWLGTGLHIGIERGTVDEAKAAVEVAAKALGHRSYP